MSTTTFENAKLGDKVWSPVSGWGIIKEFYPDLSYSLTVEFPDGIQIYTVNGVINEMVLNRQSLFWDEVEIIAPTQPLRTKLINGVEVPDIGFTPKEWEKYAYPRPDINDLFSTAIYSSNYEVDSVRVKRGLCYPFTEEGKQAAILHAKALLGISSLDPVKEEEETIP